MIIKLEQLICEVVSILEEKYINLFSVEFEENLVNLSSDIPVTNPLKTICSLLKNVGSSNTIALSKNVSMEIKHYFLSNKKEREQIFWWCREKKIILKSAKEFDIDRDIPVAIIYISETKKRHGFQKSAQVSFVTNSNEFV